MIRRLFVLLVVAALGVVVSSAQAQVVPGEFPGGGNPQEMIQKMLNKYDINGDGQISPDEAQKIGQGLVNGDIPLPPPVVAQFDRDRDGVLNQAERLAAIQSMQKMMNNGPKTGVMPNNGTNGKPIPAAKKKTAKEKIKESLDTNGDGKISEEEREAAREKTAKAKADYAKKLKSKGKKKDEADEPSDEPAAESDEPAEEKMAADEEKPAAKPAEKSTEKKTENPTKPAGKPLPNKPAKKPAKE